MTKGLVSSSYDIKYDLDTCTLDDAIKNLLKRRREFKEKGYLNPWIDITASDYGADIEIRYERMENPHELQLRLAKEQSERNKLLNAEIEERATYERLKQKYEGNNG